MSNQKNMLFFNKEGDYLNFKYNDSNDRFEGDILFSENSSDTFKTVGLYMLESIPSFEFEAPDMSLNKFQLFNEYGINFYSSSTFTQSITKVEPVNNDPNFYSKWIYGNNIESILPIGTILKFNTNFLEFTNPLQTYIVVSTKKGAIMILSSVDNATFESSYYSIYNDNNSYTNITISGINAIGIYNYIDTLYKDNLSSWNEPSFYDKLYKRKKINITNSLKNDSIVTVKNEELTDTKYFGYYTTKDNLGQNDLVIELTTKTNLPLIYSGTVGIDNWNSLNVIKLSSVPDIIKPGTEIKIEGSSLNQIFLTVSDIPTFVGNSKITYYEEKSQVIWNNKIYECTSSYTQSYVGSFSLTNPDSSSHWTSNITYIPVDQNINIEYLSIAQIYLTTNKVYFYQSWSQSSSITLASAAEKYKDDIKIFNINLYYENNTLKADLKYPSKYAEISFYKNDIDPLYKIGGTSQTYERLIQVEEVLKSELNRDISSNFVTNIVFTDIDEYGIKIIINKQVYEEEVSWLYNGSSIDMERTIDRTLRAWLSRNYLDMRAVGINAELQYIGSFISPFFNSIKTTTIYPNVPIFFNNILVGTTADYYIEHSNIIFNDLGKNLSILINGDIYDQDTIYLSGTYSSYPDIPSTIENWVDEHYEYLFNFGIIVSSINNMLKFSVKRVDKYLDYSIKTGKISLPGLEDYIINKRLKGGVGIILSSNEITLTNTGTYSFEDAGFSTGMAISLNNSFYTYNNQEYNIQFLDPGVFNLSYQGPFFDDDYSCNNSSFITIAFNSGFGKTACDEIAASYSTYGGPFDKYAFGSAFSILHTQNTYAVTSYNISQYSATTDLVDIIYLQISSKIYAYGTNLTTIDSISGNILSDIILSGNTQSVKMEFNPFNNYLYCLSKSKVWVIDPIINTIITSMTFSNNAGDIKVNSKNGDIYISFEDYAEIKIYEYTNTLSTTINSSSTNFPINISYIGKMEFNLFEEDMYISTDDTSESILRIDGSTREIKTTYNILGATSSLYYEPVNDSIYVFGSASLYKIASDITSDITSISTTAFNNIIFNNISSIMNISLGSTSFKALELDDTISADTNIGTWGYMAINQFDSDIYISSLNSNAILVTNPEDGSVIHTESLTSQSSKIIYNPDRKSIWAIQPGINSIVEITVSINSIASYNSIVSNSVGENLYGTLDSEYTPHESIWLKSKEYLRRPREGFTGDATVKYYWKWLSDNVPEFFLYDFSGNMLETSGSYSYTGDKPLSTIVLNKLPNKEYAKSGFPEYQQTIFDKIEYTLSYIDDENDISSDPEPLELFIGFKAEEEGGLRSILQLYKSEDVENIYESSSTNELIISLQTLYTNDDTRGVISISSPSETFIGSGLKEGQYISIYVKDITNSKNQYISYNNGIRCKIRNVFSKSIIVDFIDDELITETSVISDYPKASSTTYCKVTIHVDDHEIGRFLTYAQTEIEDLRFKIELNNIGKLIDPNEVFIFKEYDILEGGIDWTILNTKRKEMLMMKHLIYPFIGSYKSIINAINFFGYNDLQLNEYYKNIDPESENFLKLFKVEIPDIFDNSVEGWTESEFVKNNFPNDKHEETNLLNLTYFITDSEGNNQDTYSIDEIIIKLQGLKYWLKRNIIPLTHKILDITGKSYFNAQNTISHTSYDVRYVNINENMSPISFKLNEVYLMPINSGSTVYNCVLDFYSIIEGIGFDKTNKGLIVPTKPYNSESISLPDYYNIFIKTYKTYSEWSPFNIYDLGDKITYYGKLYESSITNNRLENPKKYENSKSWKSGTEYKELDIVKYSMDIFIYGSTSSGTSSISPIVDTNWLKITKWKEIDFEPVQNISEFRLSSIMTPFNFTLDSNIDPLVTIEVTSDNGYGLIYRDKKNYEIRGTKDIITTPSNIDKIGPFIPITPI